MRYFHGKKSAISPEAPSARGFAWFFGQVTSGADLSDKAEVRHEGRCGKCARKLTTPESVDTGFGPECSDQLGIEWATRTEGHKYNVADFMVAGNAIFTVTSKKTGTRFTYRVRKGKDESAPYFVSVLTGSDNESDYRYLGTIFP